MTTISPDLPSFRKPPVQEVVLGVQFEAVEGLLAPHMGLLWTRFRREFPRTYQHHPLPPVIEQLGPPPWAAFRPIEIVEGTATPRIWFESDSKAELIQVQADRLLHNWRREPSSTEYPRYSLLRKRFQHELDVFLAFISEERLGQFLANQCEVTFVNHIVPADGELAPDAEAVCPFVRIPESASFVRSLGRAEVRADFRLPMNASDGTPLGRLTISLAPRYHLQTGARLLQLMITARGIPLKPDVTGVLDFLDIGHEYVVRSFADATTPAMHALWERER